MRSTCCRLTNRCFMYSNYMKQSKIINNNEIQFKFNELLNRNYQIGINYNAKTLTHKKYYCSSSKSLQETNCWNCQTETKDSVVFCKKCGILQYPNKNINYFQFLSIQQIFTINSADLTKRFRELQNLVHPDRFSNKQDNEKTLSQEWSSLINKAYKTLSTPIERGQYMLKLAGHKLPEDNSALNLEFLAEMMERNEEIEMADAKNIENLLKKVQNDLNDEANKLGQVLDHKDYENGKAILVKMKYLKSIENSIKDKLQKFTETMK